MNHASVSAPTGPNALRRARGLAALAGVAVAAVGPIPACTSGSSQSASARTDAATADSAAIPPEMTTDGGGGDATAPSIDAGGPVGSTRIPPVAPDDIPGLTALLADGKLRGYIHGAVEASGLYVFTYRDPTNFFSFDEFPLTPATDAVALALSQVKRHDAVALQGTFIDNGAPIHHIRVQKLSVIASYQTDENPSPRPHETLLPEALAGQTEAIGKVHAIGSDGAMLVIEYGDAVVPVFVRIPALTAGLYRNDKIRLAFELAIAPPMPTHLWLDTSAAKPIEVLERLVDLDGKPFVADGALVRFPKSEQISVDVYAVQVIDADGVGREYTLVNSDSGVFTAIAAKLAAAWKSRPGQAVDGRNKLVNPLIRVHASGTFSVQVPNQANAQIVLDSPDDVTLTFVQ